MRNWLRAALGSILLTFATLAATPAQAQSWQCAPFARVFSGIQLFGDAYSWWQKAVGKYQQGSAPKAGSVLVFKAFGAMRVGHVATVTQVISDRVIKVTHANWSRINGAKGRVERDVTVVDASEKGDWSAVKVWFDPIKSVGIRAYPTYGFIYGKSDAPARIDVAALADDGDDEVLGS